MDAYELAMTTAGAAVHAFKSFGSYSGDWWAKVTYEGKTGWVNGSFGSCSGCDAFQSEFAYQSHECGGKAYHDPIYGGFTADCRECQELKTEIATFGKKYLDNIISQDDAEKKAGQDESWDLEAASMVQFIRENN